MDKNIDKFTFKAARINANLTQKQLADLMGVHENTVASWEKDSKKMSIADAEEFCAIVNLPFNKIFWG